MQNWLFLSRVPLSCSGLLSFFEKGKGFLSILSHLLRPHLLHEAQPDSEIVILSPGFFQCLQTS